jgi:hypothetical protein
MIYKFQSSNIFLSKDKYKKYIFEECKKDKTV